MRRFVSAFAIATLLSLAPAFAKGIEKGTLPPGVLRARTVAIVIDPEAGVSLSDPQANQVARRDVEAAMANWGRFQPVLSTQAADLIIVVRRGHDKLVDDTIRDTRQNSRPGSVTPSDDGISIGGQHGQQVHPDDTSNRMPSPSGSQVEVGSGNDSFAVYENSRESSQDRDPLNAPAAWRYEARGGLKPHSVPAVEQFRKAIAVADKIAAKHP